MMKKVSVDQKLLMGNMLGWISIGLALAINPVRAEDPLLGEIKVIKCVGCEEGRVTLVIHDPIDVRDFDVTIPVADYGKIITPLPGKRVFDRGDGCFYWNDVPKLVKKDTAKTPALEPVKETGKKAHLAKTNKKGKTETKPIDEEAKRVEPASSEPVVAEGVPSKCIPYLKVALPKVGKQD
jgi:hypothetical protein